MKLYNSVMERQLLWSFLFTVVFLIGFCVCPYNLPQVQYIGNVDEGTLENEVLFIIGQGDGKITWFGLRYIDQHLYCQHVGGPNYALRAGVNGVLPNIVFQHITVNGDAFVTFSADVIQCMNNYHTEFYITRSRDPNCALTFTTSRLDIHGTVTFANVLFQKVCELFPDEPESIQAIQQYYYY